jgi:hypothetical protein
VKGKWYPSLNIPIYPSFAKSMAVCLPIPREAPMTRATGFAAIFLDRCFRTFYVLVPLCVMARVIIEISLANSQTIQIAHKHKKASGFAINKR